ncbi:hypothetical protein ACLKA6_019271 [Drosophila palustris]
MSALYRLEMKPNFKYVKTVSRAFHLSSATLESGHYAKLYLTVNSKKLEVASLTRTVRQRSVDLTFAEGDKLIFHVVGKGDITLMGYTLPRVQSDSEDDDDENDAGYDDDEFKEDEASDASDENSDDDNELMDAPPRKKLRLSLDPYPNLESNADADMEVDPQDADGRDGADVKMSTEDD